MRLLLILWAALCMAGCAGKPAITDSDRRDAQVILKEMDFPIGAVSYEQAHLPESKPHSEGGETRLSFIKQADETRTKYKGSAIEPQVSKLCLALTTYWELPSGTDPKAKAAAAEVEQAKAALQAVADAK